MRVLTIALLTLLFAGCAAIPRPSGTSATGTSVTSDPPYSAWARVLERFVDSEGRVNFAALSKDSADLDRFVAYVYDSGPNNKPELFPTPNYVMAFHLNAYNALAMHKVIKTGIPQTLAGLRKVSFFAFGKVQVGGQPISLYDYENKVIRSLGDPRVHMTLNCMSISCPVLPREVFLPTTVDQQLNRETTKFFNEPRNVTVDHEKKVAILSEILKFYPDDFLAKAPSLTAYANLFRNEKIPETYRVDFWPYDWTVNRQPGS
jgi:Protein of unknown function, DUF547